MGGNGTRGIRPGAREMLPSIPSGRARAARPSSALRRRGRAQDWRSPRAGWVGPRSTGIPPKASTTLIPAPHPCFTHDQPRASDAARTKRHLDQFAAQAGDQKAPAFPRRCERPTLWAAYGVSQLADGSCSVCAAFMLVCRDNDNPRAITDFAETVRVQTCSDGNPWRGARMRAAKGTACNNARDGVWSRAARSACAPT